MTDNATGVPAGTISGAPTSIVLVHGAFVDGSGWQPVHDLLTRRGFEVLVVQNPTLSLDGDVAATERVIAMASHPVVLVGHSYGGAVVTEVGDHPGVKAIAYIAAFAPDVGDSVASLNATAESLAAEKAPVVPLGDGFLIVEPADFPQAFAADVDPVLARFMADAQKPWGLPALTSQVTRAGWKEKPSFYLVAAEDRMIPPRAQRQMAERIGAAIMEIGTSHAAMLARPQQVADFIEHVAGAA